MNWKEFFKPTRGKVIVSLIIGFLFAYFSYWSGEPVVKFIMPFLFVFLISYVLWSLIQKRGKNENRY